MPPVKDNHVAPAKITRPRLSDITPRPRLFQRLDRARRRPLIWLMGPPGSGKTTLVADYLARRRLRTLWYQADAGDSDIATFFHFLGLAAHKAAPRVRRPLPALHLENIVSLESHDRTTQQYFRDLYTRCKPPFVWVIDNYQDVAPESRLHDFLRHAVEELPEHATIIVISRSEPPASLARLRLNASISMLEEQDLRFTLPEARGLIRQRRSGPLSRAQLSELHALTQGWVAGLVLLLEQSDSGLPQGAGLPRTPGVLYDYFAAEVFGKTDPGTQDVLLKSVFLPTLTARTLAELSGERRAGRILNHLSRNHFFTQRYDLPEPVFRYHPMFHQFLLSRARRLTPAALADIRRRTAVALERTGQEEQALAHYLELADWESLERCIVRLAPLFMNQGRQGVLEHWLRQFPADRLSIAPWLLYWLGRCQLPGNPEDAKRLLMKALDGFREQGVAHGANLAWCHIVTSLLDTEDITSLNRWIDLYSTLPSARTTHNQPPSQVTLVMLNILVLARLNHPDRPRWCERAHALLRARHTPADIRLDAAVQLAQLYRSVGNISRAREVFGQLETLTLSPELPPLSRVNAHILRAQEYWMSAEPEKSLKAVYDGLALTEAAGLRHWDPQLFVQAAAAALTANNLEAAEDWLDRLVRVLSDARPLESYYYHILANWLALLRGDVPSATMHLTNLERKFETTGPGFIHALYQHALAQTLLQSGNTERAAESIAKLMHMGQVSHSRYIQFLGQQLKAQWALETGNAAEAQQSLAAALAGAREQQLVNCHGWLPRAMARLGVQALKNGIETDTAQGWIQRRALPATEDARDLDVWPWPVKIYTLGRFSILRDEQPVVSSGRAQSRPLELLRVLLAHGGRGIPESTFAAILWPDADGDCAHRAFDTTLHRLRKLLGHERALLLSDGKLSVNSAVCWVDVWAFERILGQLDALFKSADSDSDVSDQASFLAHDLGDLYRGPFLGHGHEHDDAWIVSARERLRGKLLHQLAALSRYWEDRGNWERAAETYHKAIDIHNLAEEYYQRLMLAYGKLGRPSEATAVYRRCRETLQAGLGRAPSGDTDAIHQQLELTP